MSEFGAVHIDLPYDLEAALAEYDALTARMARQAAPEGFSRDEWGYLLGFLRGAALRGVFESSFAAESAAHLRPVDEIAIWLPNNVSLLGPLTVSLCLLTGARVRAKAGSASENLTARLRDHILELQPGPVLTHLWGTQLETAQFGRSDARNAVWSAEADARIFFGGDEGAAAVAKLPAKTGAPFYAFADHSSLIWAEASALDSAGIDTILRVFQVYGKAGCTSPQRVVLIDGTAAEAQDVAARLAAAASAEKRLPPVHIASDTLMSAQVAQAKGWQAWRADHGSAVFMAGGDPADALPGLMNLPVMALPLQAALDALPGNIQTIGHLATPNAEARWDKALAGSAVLRFVPARQMHHFGPVWDGQAFWRGLFQEVP